ncbi:hypothetical protein P8V03_14605 [Clostridium sp. A1-XYC3]|uniref:Uncharacterized protein n=1 Tax=Clostridium tanneri TaxID=3037988 RepID=A0ABU4JW37_9CLOT|nr:hypothetical protein [Clostridium sp. A1-XYC3]MDW8802378.1 hypothetical protein [Clostridium sp. A1-XYC3]
MVTENYSLEYITETELESIRNFAIKECFEIILEETEYFFQSKEYRIDIFAEGVDFSKLSPKCFQERFVKVLYSKKELECFILRIEKKIQKELMRLPIKSDFKLHNNKVTDLLNIEDSFLFIYEAARTYGISCVTSKTIDKLWKKNISSFMPKGLGKLTNKFKAGDYFLSTIGLTTGEIKCSISEKVSKSAQGILMNKKHEIIKFLKNEVITQVANSESINHTISLKREIIKTA